jgi:hypothetical protein
MNDMLFHIKDDAKEFAALVAQLQNARVSFYVIRDGEWLKLRIASGA